MFFADYPMALKIGAGQICAVSGERWAATLHHAPQNYVVLTEQLWLDGFRITKDVIRQFVAVPLGKGLTVEHQLTGQESWGGIQLQAFPLNVNLQSTGQMEVMLRMLRPVWHALVRPPTVRPPTLYVEKGPSVLVKYAGVEVCVKRSVCSIAEAGLGAGGRMKQEIKTDSYGVGAWDTTLTSRCFVHLCLAEDWQCLTGTPPPHEPPTAKDYADAGLPWFDYEELKPAIAAKTALRDIKTVHSLIGDTTGQGIPENQSVKATNVVKLLSAS